jgi:hypothetical protein
VKCGAVVGRCSPGKAFLSAKTSRSWKDNLGNCKAYAIHGPVGARLQDEICRGSLSTPTLSVERSRKRRAQDG